MNQEEFTLSVKRTESPNFFIEKINPRLLHGIFGLATESAELMDAVKKTLFYGKELDIPNIKEEIGDLAYYLFLILDAIEADWDEILTTNVSKLEARFPDKFTSEKAINRDLQKERAILERPPHLAAKVKAWVASTTRSKPEG